MSERAIADLLARARSAGLIAAAAPADAAREPARPWPLVLLTALGAWLAALPLCAFVFLLFGDALERTGALVGGSLAIGVAVLTLRRPRLPLFLEQLAVPLLLAGLGLLGWGIADLQASTHLRATLALMSLLSLTCALLIDRAWLRGVLAALAALLLGGAFFIDGWAWRVTGANVRWFAWHLVLVPGVIAAAWPPLAPRRQLALDALAEGWLWTSAAALAFASGRSFLIGAGIAPGDGAWHELRFGDIGDIGTAIVSALLALTAIGWLARRQARSWLYAMAPAAIVAVALAAAVPMLGGALLIAALATATRRWRLALVAGLAALWIIGAFYYQLQWTLTTKGALLIALAALLGASALWQHVPRQSVAAAAIATTTRPRDWRDWALAASPLLVLALATGSIIGNERIIAHGSPLFVQLAPVDPRSLMAGDYMALRFVLPADKLPTQPGLRRPRLAITRDARGVATHLRVLDPGQEPAHGEIVVELTPAPHGWTLASDAWHFREGEAQRWSKARYGEFRVLGNGSALLVGLRGGDLQPL